MKQMYQTSLFHSAVLAALMVASPYQVAAQVTGDESNETSASSGGTVEEVIVYGIQQSLESALEQKRQQKNLIEVINAEDIGKMPDENLAEVLENIPGVQISRNAGIGSSVAVRGSEDNRVEINGRGTTPAGDNRGGMSFEDLPAALVRSLSLIHI